MVGTHTKSGPLGNVEDIVDASLCMGCGVCEPVCPVRCIEIGESPVNGQLVPFVDQPTCIPGCDVCLRVCPGEEVDFPTLNEEFVGRQPVRHDVGFIEQTLVGHATDEDLRFSSSSGGAATAFLVYLLENDFIDGAIVVRMSPERPSETEVVVARTVDEIRGAKGSKYCPAKSGVGLRAVMREPGRYAFVGLSCHVHGVRKFQQVFKKYRDRIVVTLGLFCGGGITMNGTRFLLDRMEVEEQDLVQLTLRGDGWPGKTTAVCRDGSAKNLNKRAAAKSATEAATYNSWMHRYFFPPRCLTCTDLTAQLADVSFGDPWLKRFVESDTNGTSMMVARSAIGSRLLQLAIRDGAIEVFDTMTDEEVAQSQGKLPVKTNTRPYRIAARLFGVKTPEYAGLYEDGSCGPGEVLRAVWEYARLWLGRRRWLWGCLVRLEVVLENLRQARWRWRGRVRRAWRRLVPVRKRDRSECESEISAPVGADS